MRSRKPVTPRKPEDQLLVAVIELARLCHLRTAHFRPAQTQNGRWVTPVQGDGKGWPDLTIVGPAGILFRELKDNGKYPTPEQRVWLDSLRRAGADADVWRPKDLVSGRIQHELEALRRPSMAEVARG